jgi:hypothetical protein
LVIFKKLVALSAAKASMKKGKARPMENMSSIKKPYLKLWVLPAIKSTEESTGPMQGVQPKENAQPRTKAENGLIALN